MSGFSTSAAKNGERAFAVAVGGRLPALDSSI